MNWRIDFSKDALKFLEQNDFKEGFKFISLIIK